MPQEVSGDAELRGLHNTHLQLVAMLSHFTSWNPELRRRMRRIWVLLDLNGIELQARYIRNEANEWGDRLSTED
ncbi:hypothetical protein CYMTET_49398 [Cymbomonas tetramitiformis]|uniref:Uncharacterized protein n=1 Tax=Cymbomonas tetramitiformis TaxID=36881 RepID=A0AAE0BRK5_9CHLO|nr:hypothetical protein CYMTET_49398 [Cymbomonas tetramitiformis]